MVPVHTQFSKQVKERVAECDQYVTNLTASPIPDAGLILFSTDQVEPLSHHPEQLQLGEDFEGERLVELLVPGEVSVIPPGEEHVSNNHLEPAHRGNFAAQEVFFAEWGFNLQVAGFHICMQDMEMPSNQQQSGIVPVMDMTPAAHNPVPIRPNGPEDSNNEDPSQSRSDGSDLMPLFTEFHKASLLDVPNLSPTAIEERDPSLFAGIRVGGGALLKNKKEVPTANLYGT